MRELLNEKENRRLELVEMIYLNPGIRLKTLSEKLYLTIMQLQIDIGFLNQMISPLFIEVTGDKRCYLQIPQEKSMKIIYQTFLKESLTFRLLETVFFNEHDNYEKLAKELFISQATLKRTISFINLCLAPYQIRIKSRPVQMVGDENNIRAFYIFYFQERYPDDEYPFDKIIKDFSLELIDVFMEKFPSGQYNYPSHMRMKRYLLVALTREKQHHVPSQMVELPKDLQELVQSEISHYQNKNNFEYYFKIELTVDVYQRLFRYFLNDWYALSERDFKERVGKTKGNREVFEGIINVIETLSDDFSIPVTHLEKLTLNMYNVISIAKEISITPYIIFPNRKTFLLLSHHLKETVQSRVKSLFQENLPMIAASNNAYFYEFFYLLVTHWQGFYHYLIETTPPCRIVLFFNSDVEHMYYMSEHLNFLFGKKVKVTTLYLQTSEELSKATADYDLVLINFILPENIKLVPPYISVIDVLGIDELTQIEVLVNQQYYHNMSYFLRNV
ncbi:helix-turn-helix domain-containing protein [Vagococcus elongatus]|uniref:Mga helix-turn-helix domain-containing protein n=1 Tax=Vagococcus elongatus TaxID=180344 RepID=A0A430B570_9ENTE|nr:helix-turn-helix domain-containing protein [Vagococcus elongatus]RSU15500.1 hypothetical protein CBF29_00005 [Vagococcus elongatus]